MKRLYITEGQKQIIEQLVTNGSTRQLLKEENSTQRKKCVENITNNCPWQIREYINYKLEDLPYYLQEILNPSGQLYQQVSSAPEGLNRLIDYLRLNLYSQFGIKRGTSLVRLIPGISRIACEDLKFYSFSYSIRGGDIIRLSRLLKLIDRKPEIMHIDGLNLDSNLNGMTYEELMSLYDEKIKLYQDTIKKDLNSEKYKIVHAPEYTIVEIPDTLIRGYGGYVAKPTAEGRQILNRLGRYTDWCVCNHSHADEEYAQYMSSGGKAYVCMKNGFENIRRPENVESALDEYGLSLIFVIVGSDGLPDNVTTRYNHDFDGENHSDFWEATHLQKVLQVKYSDVFKPRTENELRQMHLAENKNTPSAQDQVKNKVNASLLDAITGCGMCEEVLTENQNDKLANDYLKRKFNITDFKKIREMVMHVMHVVPNVRYNKNFYLLGVLRLIFDENKKGSNLPIINDILYNIRQEGASLSRDLDGLSFDELKEMYHDKQKSVKIDSVEKFRKAANGYEICHIENYADSRKIGSGDWCITYNDSMWQEMVDSEYSVYIVRNQEMMNRAFSEPDYQENEWAMSDPNEDDLGTFGSGKAPYDTYGLSKFVVLVCESYRFCVYSRWNLPNLLDGDYLNAEQLETLLGMPFKEAFPYVPLVNDEEFQFGAVSEGAEPESDRYMIGSEGGNNDYFHVVNEEKEEEIDLQQSIDSINDFMESEGLKIYPYPKLELNGEDQKGLFITTGYYLPSEKKVVLFTKDRHPKDILRSYAHEMIHHMQNLEGKNLNFSSDDDVKDNKELEKLESEAYLKGNIYFRKWTEYERSKDNKKQLNESPDTIEVANIHYDDDCARPFFIFKGFPNEPIIGVEGQTHDGLMMDFMGDLEEFPEGVSQELIDAITSKQLRPILTEAYELMGRYFDEVELPWAGKIISVYDYNRNNLKNVGQKLVPVIKKLQEWGINVNISDIDFDDWGGDKSFRYPFSWLLNGLADIYVEAAYSLQRDKSNERTYTFIGKNGVSFRLDANGEVIEVSSALREALNPQEVDLSSFNVKKNLNPKFWKNDRLDSRIRMKLLDIADDFIEFLGVDWVKPQDIILTGSLANYNWNKTHSDIDLHILMDFSKVDKRKEFVKKYFNAQKNLWNEEHKDLTIYGFTIELYVQDINEKHSSTGVYSLDRDKWIEEPERKKLSNEKLDKDYIKKEVSKYTKKIDGLYKKSKEMKGDEYKSRKVYEDAQKLFDEIKNIRKSDLSKNGKEMSEGNIIFKCLRRLNYIDKLDNIINKGYNYFNSLY